MPKSRIKVIPYLPSYQDNLFVYFRSFITNNTIFYNKSMWKMSFPSSIRHQDSNPWPLECESPPITTRPGLPPNVVHTEFAEWLLPTLETFVASLIEGATTSVTRLGNFLHFGHLFKAFGNNEFSKSFTFLDNFCKSFKIYYFPSEIIFGQLL